MRESVGKKSIFDGVADLYDLTRPEYPSPLIDDLIECSGLNTESRILEIGSGTGILTKALAFRVSLLRVLNWEVNWRGKPNSMFASSRMRQFLKEILTQKN